MGAVSFFNLSFYFSITVYRQYCFVLISGVQHSGWTVSYFTKRCPWYFKYAPGTRHSYYNIIGFIPCAALDTPQRLFRATAASGARLSTGRCLEDGSGTWDARSLSAFKNGLYLRKPATPSASARGCVTSPAGWISSRHCTPRVWIPGPQNWPWPPAPAFLKKVKPSCDSNLVALPALWSQLLFVW